MKKCGKLKRSATLILILSHRFLAQPIAPDPQQQCSNNPACVTLKFEGSCCPTDDFRWLDCCSEKNKSDERISVNRSLLSAQCSQYSGCAHLANDCCPTRDGVMLDCCNSPLVAALISPSNQPTTPAPASSSPNPVAAADTNENKKCSRYSGCAHLANDCCPTKAGVMLECCNSPLVFSPFSPSMLPTISAPTQTSPVAVADTNEEKSYCSSHSKCPDFDVPCCPNKRFGTYLSCCEDDALTDPQFNDNIFLTPAATPNQLPSATPTRRPTISDLNLYDTIDVQWGSNVYQIDGSWSTPEIQRLFDSIFQKQVNNEMGEERYGIYFHPGVYGSASQPLMIQVGYYTEIAGLGMRPSNVVIYGKIEVYNRCFDPVLFNQEGQFVPSDGSGHCIALNNFWRSLSNLSIHIISKNQDNCRSRANFWAVSQASSMRRVSFINGDVSLMDYCTMPAFASGGFVADSKFTGEIENGSQQQWFSRNIDVEQNWSGAVWNQVFLGSRGVPPGNSFPDPPISSLPETPLSREKPFLYLGEDDNFFVFVPSTVTNTKGPSWDRTTSPNNDTPGRSISLNEILVITPSTDSDDIDRALDRGMHLLFTPGVFDIYKTIEITKPGTIVLGMGHATLTARNGVVPIKTSNAPGIVLAGITIDAGEAESPYLLQVGSNSDESLQNNNPDDPITLSDVYIRVGGPHIGKTTVAIEINPDNVLIDHTWIWRADHGIEEFDLFDGYSGDNERWRTNTGRNGIIVNGNGVTAMGLFVEHFQEHNLIWNGEDGTVYMFQSELAYEPPFQSEWTTPDGILGFAAYKVSNQVQRHYLLGGGVYCYNRNNPSIITEQGFEVPFRSGVVLEHIMTRNLSGPGVIESIVNAHGDQVDTDDRGPQYLVAYPSGREIDPMTISESTGAVHQYEEINPTGENSHGLRTQGSQYLLVTLLSACSMFLAILL